MSSIPVFRHENKYLVQKSITWEYFSVYPTGFAGNRARFRNIISAIRADFKIRRNSFLFIFLFPVMPTRCYFWKWWSMSILLWLQAILNLDHEEVNFSSKMTISGKSHFHQNYFRVNFCKILKNNKIYQKPLKPFG